MKKYTLIIAALFTVGISSCKKDFLSLEVNPNTPSVTTPQFALAGAEKTAADIVNTNYNVYGVWGGFWTTSGNYVPSPQIQQYQFATTDFQVFTGLFANATNFDYLEKLGAGNTSLAKFQAIAKIMKAYDFQQLVDVYNDVPYTQAFQASTYLFPKYDKGQDIYNDLATQLVAAIGIINANPGATDPGISDIVYRGNMTSWKKFAHTLLLRLAIRQSNTGGGTAKTLLASVAAEGFIDAGSPGEAQPGTLDADGKLIPGYTGSSAEGQQSPFWRSYGFDISGNATGNNAYYRANNFAVGLLNSYNDPRLQKFYALSGGSVKGLTFGDPSAVPNANSSAIGPGLLKAANMNANLFSVAESLFLQAEAAQSGGYGVTGTPQALYEAGITASFVAVGLTPAQASTYYSQDIANVSWASSPNKLQAIGTQKWISLNGYSNLEAFSEFKRTGYPVGVPRSVDSKAIGAGIPNRIFFPSSEYQQNAEAVGAEGTIDPFTSKIFWQK